MLKAMWQGKPPRVTGLFMIVFAVTYVLQTILDGVAGLSLTRHLLILPGSGLQLAWTWFTYAWFEVPAPGTAINRALSILMMYWFLSPFEARYGRRPTTILILLGVVAGGLGPTVLALLNMDGAAGMEGVDWVTLLAFVAWTKNAETRFLLLPPMRASTVIGIFFVILVLNSMWSHSVSPVLSALGAGAAGYYYTRWLDKPKTKKKKPFKMPPNLSVVPGGASKKGPWLN